MLARIDFVAGVALAFVAALALSSVSLTAHADDATIAVAANFVAPAEALQKLFEQRTPHHLKFTSGSTSQLYAQIATGAPLDALLSADREHVDQLITAGLADASLRFTYAIGKLALWTRETDKFKPLDLSRRCASSVSGTRYRAASCAARASRRRSHWLRRTTPISRSSHCRR
jgi:ABC-type molybdate transport system substrate-binding protein